MKTIKYQCEKYILEYGDLDSENSIVSLAIENYKEHNDICLEVEPNEFKHMLEMIGFSNVEIYYSGFYSQGDGASFEGNLDINKITQTNIKKALEYINKDERLEELLNNLYKTTYDVQGLDLKITKSGRYQHEMTMDIEVEDYDDRNCREDMYSKAGEILTICRYLAVWFYNKLKQSYEYENSDETIFNTLVNGEYEINEKGEILYV